jgi:hypothetical protein
MRKLLKITSTAIFVLILPLSALIGQEKKTEQKIKIITDNGSGKQVMVDTVFTGKSPDSLKLKDGTVIYISRENDNSDMISDGNKHVFVSSYSSDGNKDGKTKQEITIIKSDSASSDGSDGKVMYYSNNSSDQGNTNVHYKIIKKSEGADDMQVYYIDKKSYSDKDPETFNVYVTKDDQDSGIDKNRYVIAKDGIVVTVEGVDEAKTKELVNEIEKKMDIQSEPAKKVSSETGKKSKK